MSYYVKTMRQIAVKIDQFLQKRKEKKKGMSLDSKSSVSQPETKSKS